jgi:hypothetical protein
MRGRTSGPSHLGFASAREDLFFRAAVWALPQLKLVRLIRAIRNEAPLGNGDLRDRTPDPLQEYALPRGSGAYPGERRW